MLTQQRVHVQQLQVEGSRAWSLTSARLSEASSAYSTVRPQVTLCGSCRVKKSSATLYSHLCGARDGSKTN